MTNLRSVLLKADLADAVEGALPEFHSQVGEPGAARLHPASTDKYNPDRRNNNGRSVSRNGTDCIGPIPANAFDPSAAKWPSLVLVRIQPGSGRSRKKYRLQFAHLQTSTTSNRHAFLRQAKHGPSIGPRVLKGGTEQLRLTCFWEKRSQFKR